LGSVELLTPVVMVNVLGQHMEPLLDWLLAQTEEAQGLAVKVHLYGKKEANYGRKMGHLNLLTNDIDRALEWVEQTEIWAEEMSKL
jgi:5-(carboxyamino)imidazole ribonucleotide synthase